MADIRLTFAMTPYDRMLPLISGEVKPDGITLDFMKAPGGGPVIFYEQEKFQRFASDRELGILGVLEKP